MDLFASENTGIALDMVDANVLYFPNFLSQETSQELLSKLRASIQWQQDTITVFGKTYNQPRLTALYGDPKLSYSYSNITMHPHAYTEELLEIKHKVETISNAIFTTCLLNLYRDGNDSNGWHADNEKELGPEPIIASLSLGEERWFHFKHKTNKNLRKKLILQNGSLLLMQGKTQENWLHQIPKSKKITNPRINITFRIISH